MFTGIIEATARVERVEPKGGGSRLVLATARPLAKLAIGDLLTVKVLRNGKVLDLSARRLE